MIGSASGNHLPTIERRSANGRMCRDAKMSYDWLTDSRPQVGRSLADLLHVARQGSAVGRRSADHQATVGQMATVGRMENFVVGEGNQ